MGGTASHEKPDSLPAHWPQPTAAELAERPQRVIQVGREQAFHFKDNFVKTSKYELWNFLPKFLLEEFNPKTKIANCYFLVISCLQTVPQITNTGGIPTTLLPLTVVVLVDAIFSVVEDRARHRADTEANSSLAVHYDEGSQNLVDVKWSDIQVGDFIKLPNRATVPADILILGVAEKSEPAQGMCYVETKSLDGETNLKIRNAMPNTLGTVHSEAALKKLKGEVTMEHPNKLIDSFTGVLDLGSLGRDPIQKNNILLRGCVLRNTDWILGLVVNTGHDTKIMMSSTETPSKTSSLESKASDEIQKIVALLAVVCFIGTTGALIWNIETEVDEKWYLDWDPNPGEYWIIQFFYFFLLHATFIPVSLYVSMTLVRFFQSYFMNADLEMYYEKTDTPALVRTMPLNEELGQISHVFSDKTGTLTCNIMDFRKASINGVSYGLGITEIGKASWKLQGKEIPPEVLEGEAMAKQNSVPHVSFYDPDYESAMTHDSPQRRAIEQFYRILALCHDVIPERIDGKIKLSASNPDDEALVCAAAYFGFEFRDNREKIAIVYNKRLDREEEVEILEVIEFSSKRKRMSVIAREIGGSIRLYCKGADSTMIGRLKPGQDAVLAKTDADMRQYAQEGLRCLIVGYADISQETFADWYKKYRAASTDMAELDKRKCGLDNEIERLQDAIERNLTLVGSTAIEDRLQDGVPECIEMIAAAGVNIWVLTGDKEETAINIAVACNLVLPTQYMRHVIINGHNCSTKESMQALLVEEIKLFDQEAEENEEECFPRALIIDGPTLIVAMADESENGVKSLLLTFSQRCKAVVGCRVSPDQKREMVNLIKEGVPGVRTLSIGDGANDVAMIQEAHVGVGIRGEEGLQAVNSSDYAIAQFKYLQVLLLKHGRFNYIRMSNLVVYMFYKNILMSIAQFWFAWLNGFSGQKIYTEAGIQLYNLMFTSLPIVLHGVYDMDVHRAAAYKFPRLYTSGIKNENFTPSVFWTWIGNAIIEGVLLAYVPPLLFDHSDPRTGTYNTFLETGALTFTAAVVIVNFKMCFIQTAWHWFDVGMIIISILSWIAVAYAVDAIVLVDYDFYQVWSRLLASGTFWMGLLLLVVVINGKDVYLCGLGRSFDPKPYHVIQEAIVLPVSHAKTAPDDDEEVEEDEGGKYAELKLVELREMSATDAPKQKGLFGWLGM